MTRPSLSVLILCALAFSFTGCGGGKKVDGVYHAANGGPITITFKGSKATVDVGGDSKELDYKIEGNKITILNPKEGDINLTLNDDGTLSSPLGMLEKK